MAFAGGPKPAGLRAVSLFPLRAGLFTYLVIPGSRPRPGRAADCSFPRPADCTLRWRLEPERARQLPPWVGSVSLGIGLVLLATTGML